MQVDLYTGRKTVAVVVVVGHKISTQSVCQCLMSCVGRMSGLIVVS